MTKGCCSECESEELWAWYDQPERQSIAVEVNEDGSVTYGYTGVVASSYDAGEDDEYWCANCDRITKTIEEMVGAPPKPPKTGVRLKIETGIPGEDQQSSFMNATLQETADCSLEFSIATYISVSPSLRTEEELASLISNVLGPVVAADPRVSFEVQIGPAGDGETDDNESEEEED